jgi:hypothetical protein
MSSSTTIQAARRRVVAQRAPLQPRWEPYRHDFDRARVIAYRRHQNYQYLDWHHTIDLLQLIGLLDQKPAEILKCCVHSVTDIDRDFIADIFHKIKRVNFKFTEYSKNIWLDICKGVHLASDHVLICRILISGSTERTILVNRGAGYVNVIYCYNNNLNETNIDTFVANNNVNNSTRLYILQEDKRWIAGR